MLHLSLKQRTFKGHSWSVPQPPIKLHMPGRMGPRRQWSDEDMQNAITAVEQNGISLRHASEMYGVPRTTLHDHVTGRVEHGVLPGPKPYLSKEEEEELVSFCVRCASIGYPHTRYQIMALVQQILESKGIQACISDGWWERFKRRNPKINLRVAAPLSFARAIATDRDVLDRYYDLLEDTLKANGIFNNASRIFNCDETGISLSPPFPKVVHEVGAKNPCYLTGGSKTQITVLACVSAAGYAIPPFVIFDRQTLNPQLTKGEVPGTAYGLSPNGWIDMKLFCDWVFEHFLAYAPPARPLLLLLDGHSSHYCPEAIKACAEEQVILLALPPNTTHIIQPLDRGCFSPLKAQWKKIVQSYIAKKHKAVTRYEFSALFAEAWYGSMIAKNIQAGFKVSGVFPFNKHPFDLPCEAYASFKPDEVVKKSKLKYIPLYSPAPSRKERTSNDSTCGLLDETTVKDSHTDHSQTSRRRSLSDSSLCETSFEAGRSRTPDANKCMMPLRRESHLSRYLSTPPLPPSVTNRPKSSGRVLTSSECIKSLEMKERKKQEEQDKKEERKRIREENKKKRAEKAAKKLDSKKGRQQIEECSNTFSL